MSLKVRSHSINQASNNMGEVADRSYASSFHNLKTIMSTFFGCSSNLKKEVISGTHRPISSLEMLSRVTPYLSNFGITRVANVTGLDHIGIPVVMVVRPNSKSLSVSQGKGLNLVDAKLSGIMESIEHYHAENINLRKLHGSFNSLRKNYEFANIDLLPRPMKSNYSLNSECHWVEGIDLVSGKTKLIPYELVHTDFSTDRCDDNEYFFANSNGLASGCSFYDAIAHGMYEVIERDASALWDITKNINLNEKRVKLSTISNKECIDVLKIFLSAGISVAVWDTTTDIGISSFNCYICDDKLDPIALRPVAFGAGCHIDKDIALLRALNEAAQSRLTSITGSRDDIKLGDFHKARSYKTLSEFKNKILKKEGEFRYENIPSIHHVSFIDDISFTINSLRNVNINEVIVVNLTKPEYNIPVVRVIVPGLESLSEQAGYQYGKRGKSLLQEVNV